jgi:Zn-dependent protease with chaperone function
MTGTAPTILAFETDSAWVVILAVSLITLVAALLARRLIAQPGGFASGLLLSLPLVLPVLAAVAFHRAVLPEVGILRPAGPAALRGSRQLLHLLVVPNPASRVVTPYALSGSAGRWLLVFGALASAVMVLRRAAGTLFLRRLIARCRPLHSGEDHDASAILESFVERLPSRPVLLLLPDGISGAFAVGVRKPKVLLSADLLERLDREELEAILAHEVAHLEARDVPVVFLAGFLRDVVAWNPVAHVAFRHLVADREHEADRRAAVITGKPLAVASGLLKMCELMRGRQRTAGAAALGFFTAKRGIAGRVTRLMALADGVAPAPATHRFPHLLAALLVALLGLQVGSEMAARDRGAFAVVVGAPDISSEGVWVPKRTWDAKPPKNPSPRHRRARRQQRKEHVGATPAGRPLEHPDISLGVSVKAKDLPKWEKRMSRLIARQGVAIKLRWQERQDWQAIPLFAPSGGVGVYRIERTL